MKPGTETSLSFKARAGEAACTEVRVLSVPQPTVKGAGAAAAKSSEPESKKENMGEYRFIELPGTAIAPKV
jgi:hypothetical protein